ncbi:MAG TPA: hypothetical protein VHA11_05455 [Bryobacteraceae bacterium]|nr:hypothetical protein [Bryobacteraceae bacterium]
MKSTLLAYSLALAAAFSAAAQTRIDLQTQGKNIDFSEASSTKPFRTGSVLPGSCTVGETYFKTDAAAGENLYACTAADVWTLQSGANPVPATAGQANRVLSNDGSAPGWRSLGGDLSGAPEAIVVGGIQGRGISAAVPSDGEVLRWNGTIGQWQPYPVSLPGGVNYSETFADQTVVSIPGTAHGLGTASLIVACYDNATPAATLTPNSVTVHPTTYDITVTFSAAQSGRCVVNGSGAGSVASLTGNNTFAPGSVQTVQGSLIATSAERTAPVKAGTSLPSACAAGDQYFKTDAAAGQNLYFCTSENTWTQMAGTQLLTSVFGRAGAVTAAAGDYSFPQISGAVANNQIATGLDAVKIGAGTVSNTVFGYLANATADVQGQLDAKAVAGHSHTAAGDVTGDLANLTVTRLEGRDLSAAAPGDGQALVWSASNNAWQPGSVAGGGMTATQLADFAAARTSAGVLTIGANCSSSTPCNARFGNTTFNFTHSCTANLTAGTGLAYVYIAAGGALTVGHNVTLTTSGCASQAGVTSFPSDSIPLYTWTATSGAWAPTGGQDYRAMLSTKSVLAGPGMSAVESNGRTTMSIDAATVPMYLAGAAAIDFPSVGQAACSSDQTFTLLGAAVGDPVIAGWPASLPAGLTGLIRVSATNTIALRLCNLSGAAVDPASATFRATIVRSF